MRLNLGEVQEQVARGHYLRAYRTAAQYLEVEGLATQDRVELMLLVARAVGPGLGQLDEAASLAAQASVLAAEAGLHDQLQLARLTAGEAWRRLGDMARAQDWFQAFLDGDQDTVWDRRHRGVCHFNFGLVHRARRDWDQAIAAYSRAIGEFTAQGMLTYLVAAYQSLAWALLLSGRAELAAEPVRAAAVLSPQGTEEDRTHQISLEAFHALRTDQIDAAVALAEEVLTPGRAGVTDLSRAEAAMVMAEAARALDRKAEALAFAQLGIEAALKARESGVINRANQLLHQIRDSAE